MLTPVGRRRYRIGSFVFATVSLLFFSNVHAFVFPALHPPGLYLPPAGPGDWVYDKTVDNVECYHMLANCEGTTVVLLKFNNRNSSQVTIAWKEVLATQLNPQQESYGGKKQLVILPGETYPESCSDAKAKKLRIIPDEAVPTYRAEIKSFAYKDVSVSKTL